MPVWKEQIKAGGWRFPNWMANMKKGGPRGRRTNGRRIIKVKRLERKEGTHYCFT